jgi:hypothetical protein
MVDADGMVSQLLVDNKKIIEILAEVSEEADKQKQYATSNLVQSLMESHGKFVWMLRSFTEKSPKNVKEDVQVDQLEVEEEIEEELQIED